MANESDWRQPKFSPIVGGNAAVYPAGADRWASESAILEPSSGNISQGLTPGAASWLTAQTANWLLQNYGKTLDAVADVPSFTWTGHTAHVTSDYSDHTNTTTPNANLFPDHPLILPGVSGYHHFYTIRSSGGSASAVARMHLGQGLKFGGDTETFEILLGNSTGLTESDTASHRGCPIGGGRSGTLVALGATRTTAYSTDHGQNWTSGPTVPLSSNSTFNFWLRSTFFAGKWYVIDDVSISGALSRLSVATDPTDSYTEVDIYTGTTRRTASNSTTLVLLPQVDTHFGIFHSGDSTVTEIDIAGADATKDSWRAAWNDSLQLFGMVNPQGQFWTGSADGLTWNLAHDFGGALVGRDIVAHGRGFLVSNEASNFAVDYLDAGPEQTWRLRRSLQALDDSQASAFHLCRVRGRVIAARMIKPTSDQMRIEWYTSAVSPYDRIVQVGE